MTVRIATRKAAARLPGALEVGATQLEIPAEGRPKVSPGVNRFAARWGRGAVRADATVELRAASKMTTDIKVSLKRPAGAQAFLWPSAALRRQETLFAQALAYEIETRSLEDASAFEVRRTTPELTRARAS